MVKIDLKDKKILYQLDFNARQSYSELAKKVGLSKQVVEYRINRLIKENIIKKFYPVINTSKLGYLYCRLSITWENISQEEIEQIYTELKNDRRIFWMFEVQGDFDLFFVVWFKKLEDFRIFIQDFMTRYSKFVKTKVENIATDVIHYQHRYLLGIKNTSEVHVAESDDVINIDDIDKKILILLQDNARMSLIDMSKKIKEHPKTIAYRISKMEKQKLIECYRISINHKLLDHTYYKVFLSIRNFTYQDLIRIKEYIKNHPATIYIVEGINLHSDIDFEMMIKDNKDLFDFMKLLRKEFPGIIGSYRTVIFMDTLKVSYLPF